MAGEDQQAEAVPAAEAAPARPSQIEEAALDIHKPKPVHSWRELLSEIGVIIIGVLIALGAEQTIEWLHWRYEVRETREALHVELARDLGNYEFRRARQDCADRRLDELERWLDRSRQGQPVPAMVRVIGLPSGFGVGGDVWEVAKTGQVASHIPLQERLHYAQLYGMIHNLAEALDHDGKIWSDLADFNHAETLDHQDRIRLHGLIDRARREGSILRYYRSYLMGEATPLGIRPIERSPYDAAADRSFCSPLFAKQNA
jgi:hypothetical protein